MDERTNRNASLFTLFVDNLPEDVGLCWFKNLFNKFGVVRDAFIPLKKSKISGRRFGFVRYSCAVSADIAISETNGLWIGDRKLFVKQANFEKKGVNQEQKKIQTGMSNGGGVGLENFSQQNWGKWSFAEVVKEHRNSTSLSISVNEAAHEWLRKSAVAELPSIWSLEMVRQAIDLNLGPNIQVRELGPTQILLTFDSIAAMDAAFAEGKLYCLKEWCGDKIHKWNPKMRLFPSRTVWLSCYGVPIHVWSSDTFSKIGKLWGEIIKLDDDIIKERNFSVGKILVSTSLIKNINQTIEMHCKGESFPVRIIEEQVVMPDFDRAEKFPVNKEETTRETKEEELGEDDNSKGDESKIDVDDDPFMVPNSIKSKTDDSCSNCDSLLGDSREDIESFEDNAVARQLENSMEVVEEVAETDDDGANRMSHESASLSDANHIPIQATVKGRKGKRNRKSINEILGYTRVNADKIKGKRNNKKCVVLRSAVASAALSASISSNDINNRNRILLDEAQAIWEVDKLFGISYDGDENEVISKIAEMEALNKARAEINL